LSAASWRDRRRTLVRNKEGRSELGREERKGIGRDEKGRSGRGEDRDRGRSARLGYLSMPPCEFIVTPLAVDLHVLQQQKPSTHAPMVYFLILRNRY